MVYFCEFFLRILSANSPCSGVQWCGFRSEPSPPTTVHGSTTHTFYTAYTTSAMDPWLMASLGSPSHLVKWPLETPSGGGAMQRLRCGMPAARIGWYRNLLASKANRLVREANLCPCVAAVTYRRIKPEFALRPLLLPYFFDLIAGGFAPADQSQNNYPGYTYCFGDISVAEQIAAARNSSSQLMSRFRFRP